MAMTCTVCNQAERNALEHALVAGASIRDTAGRSGLSRSALSRHMKSHLPPKTMEMTVALDRDRDRADTLHERLEQLYVRAERIVAEAESAGRGNVALAGIRELRGILEFAAKLAGVLVATETAPTVIQLSFHDGSSLPPREHQLHALPDVADPEAGTT